jgi:lysosomal Pro-X carboxypeptidase
LLRALLLLVCLAVLTAWFRFKYPSVVYGGIAGSAPIFAFQGVGRFFADGGNAYWRVVTRTAGPACAAASRALFPRLLALGAGELQSVFNMCEPAGRSALDVALWVANAFDTMSMGQFNFSSNYLTGKPDVFLPPLPVTVACSALLADAHRVEGLLAAAAVFYNASAAERCNAVPRTTAPGTDDRFSGNLWSWQWCTEAVPEEFYFSMTGRPDSDMFFPYATPFSEADIAARCKRVWNATRYPFKMLEQYGTPERFLGEASRLVFSNGLFDPWSSAGIVSLSAAQQARDLHALVIPDGAHHVDLMFSNLGDSETIRAARVTEVQIIKRWVSQHAAERAAGRAEQAQM